MCDGAGGLVVAELVGMEGSGRDGGVAAVAAVGEVRRVPFAGPKWDVAVACGSLKGKGGLAGGEVLGARSVVACAAAHRTLGICRRIVVVVGG